MKWLEYSQNLEITVMAKLKALFQSRRWWVAGAAGVVATANQLGFDLNPETVQWAVVVAASWIVGDSLRETK